MSKLPWMQPRGKQRLVGINVAQPGKKRLIEQQRLELPPVTGQTLREFRRCQATIKRLRAQCIKYPGHILHQFPTAKPPRIVIYQDAPVIQRQPQMVMLIGTLHPRQVKLAGHAQMEREQFSIVKLENDKFGPTFDGRNFSSAQPPDEGSRLDSGDHAGMQHLNATNLVTGYVGRHKIAHHGFNFR